MDIATGIIILIVFLAVDIVIFLILRQLVLWYFRINEVADSIIYIANFLQRQEAKDRISAYPTPPALSGAQSFMPITTEQNERLRKGWE